MEVSGPLKFMKQLKRHEGLTFEVEGQRVEEAPVALGKT